MHMYKLIMEWGAWVHVQVGRNCRIMLLITAPQLMKAWRTCDYLPRSRNEEEVSTVWHTRVESGNLGHTKRDSSWIDTMDPSFHSNVLCILFNSQLCCLYITWLVIMQFRFSSSPCMYACLPGMLQAGLHHMNFELRTLNATCLQN